jgi:hypothetical protein
MTQDEIIEMAREVGLPHWYQTKEVVNIERLEAFAKLVADKEREACESIEYDLAQSPAMFATMAEYKSYRDGVQKYRAAIRARGERDL